MISSKELKFVVLGVVAAGFGPLVGGAFFSLIRGQLEDIGQVLVFSLLAYPFAIVFCCVFGLPLFFLARRYRLVRWWTAMGCGALVGGVGQFVVLSGTAHIDNLLLYSAHGIASALLFFAVWKRGQMPHPALQSTA